MFYSLSSKILSFVPANFVFSIFYFNVVWLVFIYDYCFIFSLNFFYFSLSLLPWHKPSKNDDFWVCLVGCITSKSSDPLWYCYSISILILTKVYNNFLPNVETIESYNLVHQFFILWILIYLVKKYFQWIDKKMTLN